jgi:hypothetical protein
MLEPNPHVQIPHYAGWPRQKADQHLAFLGGRCHTAYTLFFHADYDRSFKSQMLNSPGFTNNDNIDEFLGVSMIDVSAVLRQNPPPQSEEISPSENQLPVCCISVLLKAILSGHDIARSAGRGLRMKHSSLSLRHLSSTS